MFYSKLDQSHRYPEGLTSIPEVAHLSSSLHFEGWPRGKHLKGKMWAIVWSLYEALHLEDLHKFFQVDPSKIQPSDSFVGRPMNLFWCRLQSFFLPWVLDLNQVKLFQLLSFWFQRIFPDCSRDQHLETKRRWVELSVKNLWKLSQVLLLVE